MDGKATLFDVPELPFESGRAKQSWLRVVPVLWGHIFAPGCSTMGAVSFVWIICRPGAPAILRR